MTISKNLLLSKSAIKKIIESKKLHIFLLSIIIFCVGISSLRDSYLIHFSGDEQGPMGVAAFLIGLDWYEAMQWVDYYSYGYSFIIAPLMFFIKDMTLLYRVLIVINALMIACIVPIAYKIIKMIYKDANHFTAIIIAFFVASYPSHLIRASVAWMETTLMFVFWIITYIIVYIAYKKQGHTLQMALLAFLGVYEYILHQRSLGVLIALFAVNIILLNLEYISKRQFLIFILITIGLFIGQMFLKSFIQEEVWEGALNDFHNDYSGVFSKLKKSFTSLTGFSDLIKSLLGKIYYIAISSVFLILYIFSIMIKKIYLGIKSRKLENPTLILYIFLVISFAFTLGITALFMMEPLGTTHVVYGRYIEAVYGPLILLAMSDLFIKESKKRINNTKTLKKELSVFLAIFLIFILISFLLTNLSNNFEVDIFMPVNSFMTNFYYKDGKVNYLLGIITTGILFLAFYYGSKTNRNTLKNTAISLVAFFLLSLVYPFVQKSIIPQGQLYIADDILVDKYRYEDSPVYFSGNILYMQYFQYLSREKIIKWAAKPKELPNEEHYLVLNSLLPFYYMDEYFIIDNTRGSFLLERNVDINKESAEKKLELSPMYFYSSFFDDDPSLPQTSVQNHGKAGFLSYGPYINLVKGKYHFKFSLSIEETDMPYLGYIRISGQGEELFYRDLVLDELSVDGNGKFVVELDLTTGINTISGVEFQIYAVDDVNMSFYGATVEMEENEDE